MLQDVEGESGANVADVRRCLHGRSAQVDGGTPGLERDELAHLPGRSVHQPWDVLGGYDTGYPERIVDHAAERLDALDRFAQMKQASTT